jgi:hypothetical protein
MAPLSSSRALGIPVTAALVGLAATAVALVIDPSRALIGYLAAYVVVASTAIGALVLLLVGYATNARWLAAVRRLQEAVALIFPLLAVLFVPIAIGVRLLYPWAGASAALSERALLDAKAAWLDPVGFVVRSAFYLGVFVVASEVLRRRSVRRDARPPAADPIDRVDPDRPVDPAGPGDPEPVLRGDRMFAAAMLPPVALALSFAAIDWVMSLQPTWVSSMFPVYFFAAGFSAGIAVLTIVAARLRTRLSLTGHHFHALGRMLFAFVVFWAYASYFQGFLIQIANRPVEVTFYVPRTAGVWGVVLWAILFLRFALPFFLLLLRSPKHRPGYVATIAGIILAGHVLDLSWAVIPSADRSPSWMDLAALVGLAGACVAFAAWRMRRVPLVAGSDPFLVDGLRYESPT